MHIIETILQQNGELSYGNNPNKIILHHAECSNCSIEDVNIWHLGNKWVMCGYHYFIRKDGSIYRGRPENVIGAHCPGQNFQSIGICAEGSYMWDTMPQAQLSAIIELVNDIKNRYGIKEVGGHREYYSTDCPGTNYPLEEIRRGIMENKTEGYIVTNYLPNAWKGYTGVDIKYVLSFFKDIQCYVKGNSNGVWIETQTLPIAKCEELKNALGSWFYSIE